MKLILRIIKYSLIALYIFNFMHAPVLHQWVDNHTREVNFSIEDAIQTDISEHCCTTPSFIVDAILNE